MCRCLSGNRQLGVLEGAAAVDIVFDMAASMTCLRPVPDANSLSLVAVPVGPGPASGSGRCGRRRPRLQHGHLDDLDELFATCSRRGFAVPRTVSCRARASYWVWTLLQPSTSSSTWPPRRPRRAVCDLFPTRIRCSSCRFLSGQGQLLGLDDAAAVDLVFDMATSTTCL
jgi:hypothetical protein